MEEIKECWDSRTELLIGRKAINKLNSAKIIIYGIGGVGSYAVEALTRSGIGHLVLVDDDVISISNINRQLHTLVNNIGSKKVNVMKNRILEINPKAIVEVFDRRDCLEGEENLINSSFDYVIDAVDTISTKINLVVKAKEEEIPIISCMGAGNKLDATKFEVEDIYKTSVCPLAKIMRKELRKRKINSLKVVYSKEEPRKANTKIPGSISFVPSVAGLIMAGEVIKDLAKLEE